MVGTDGVVIRWIFFEVRAWDVEANASNLPA